MGILAAAWVLGGGFSARAQEEVIIKARVDGPSEFIVATNGFHWKNGMNAKPGRHEGRNDATYINEAAWIPKWDNLAERGPGTSEVFPWPVKSLDLEFELLAIGDSPAATTIEPRTAPAVSYGERTIVINIPDPEPGSRWYVFALVRSEAGAKP